MLKRYKGVIETEIFVVLNCENEEVDNVDGYKILDIYSYEYLLLQDKDGSKVPVFIHDFEGYTIIRRRSFI
jgi:hypothetical protein